MRKKVFIVEDNYDIGYILQYFLDEEGFEVCLFENITTFRNTFKNELPDILLLDVMLPDGNGIELCDEIKNDPRFAGIPILIMSAHTPAEKISIESCANGFIAKPFDLNVVLKHINQQLPLG